MTTLPEHAVRRCYSVVNPIHSTVYFSPEIGREFAAAGLDAPAAVYFANRAAPLGRVGAGAVTATFYNFKHDLVALHVPRIWETLSPEEALGVRLRAVDSLLRRLLGEDVLGSKELAEAAELALRAAEACARPARPLYAANADLPVPREPHLAFWHAATLLREHRGDGHLMALTTAGLGPLEALVSHTASSQGAAAGWVRSSRGWSEEEWAAARGRLRDRGLLDDAGGLTASGEKLRADLEDETDRLDAAPYEHLGPAGVARLTELAAGLTAAARAAGAFPAQIFAKR
ncbi:hypothetical protein [Streptomyces sp. NPDC095613]|uniref:SCO6745 family protein n=1 Tax=Streptomyces sp. NPDC095613 TaxID=3155540 RepID=UPI00331B2122